MARREIVSSGAGEKFMLKQAVTGVFRGTREGKFGPDAPLVDIEIDGVVKTFYGKTVLASKLRGVEEGDTVEITHLGLKPGKNGKTFNDYSVYVIDDEPEPEAEAPKQKPAPAPKPAPRSSKPKPAPAPKEETDDEVPF